MNVSEALESRRSVPWFDPDVRIELSELLALMDKANLAPSSMNLQPWEFLVCHSPEDKARLRAVSFDQAKLTQASAVVIVLGNLDETAHAKEAADSNVRLGYFSEERKSDFLETAATAWSEPRKARDEAFRAPSLWAMAFMLAAEEAGWATAPLGGYEPDKLIAEFGLPPNLIPALLVAIGKLPQDRKLLPRNVRLSAAELTHLGHFGRPVAGSPETP